MTWSQGNGISRDINAAMYAELHCHTNFSFLDGASHPEVILARAKELGMPAMAITDHNGLYSAVHFHRQARELGIKPVIGVEMTLDSGHHLLLLAKNNSGYSNLCRLVSRAQLNHSKGNASLDVGTLARHANDLFCLSGCRKGKVQASPPRRRQGECLGCCPGIPRHLRQGKFLYRVAK